MTDIVKRLRRKETRLEHVRTTSKEAADLIEQQAAEIERLREDNEKLLFAQQWIAEQARKIEELETSLEAILECVEDQDDCAVVAICNTTLKAAEAETPNPMKDEFRSNFTVWRTAPGGRDIQPLGHLLKQTSED